MQPDWDDLEDLPLRFEVPDGWRTPDPQWVSLHQGYPIPENWQPYPECPPAPTGWPFWEENGAAWYSFFRYHAPPPTRALGWWFSLAAAGLFTLTVSPFAFGFPTAFLPGGLALVALVIGVSGVVRTLRAQSGSLTIDPLQRVQIWAKRRRDEFLDEAYARHRFESEREASRAEFEQAMWRWWWRGSVEGEESW